MNGLSSPMLSTQAGYGISLLLRVITGLAFLADGAQKEVIDGVIVLKPKPVESTPPAEPARPA